MATSRVWLMAIAFSGALAPCIVSADVPGGTTVQGTVVDRTGLPVSAARVALQTAADTILSQVETDATGHFALPVPTRGDCVLDVEARGFARQRRYLDLDDDVPSVVIVLDVRGVQEWVSVTPVRGAAVETALVPEEVTVADRASLARRGFGILPQALGEESGAHVQQTSTSQGSPFVRGLTGQYVVTFIDGARFNNATVRPGANQYTALIDPWLVGRVEIVHGPLASQYGSDALGGTISVITDPGGDQDLGHVGGTVAVFGASADQSRGVGAFAGRQGRWWSLSFGGTLRSVDDLRTGGGIDSHSVVTRLLGLSSTVIGDRLAQTGFRQHGIGVGIRVAPAPSWAMSVRYLRGVQRGASRYDQLDGGAGNLRNRFDPQGLDFGVARVEALDLGLFDTVSFSGSVNVQRDDRSSQSINNARDVYSKITDENNRTLALGAQAHATRRLATRHRVSLFGELYDERVTSRRWDRGYNAGTGDFTDVTQVRARFPDGATYRTTAASLHDVITLVDDRVSASVGLRWSRYAYAQAARDNPFGASGPLVPDFSTNASDLTWTSGVVWKVAEPVSITGRIARGFRAPNVNDFGSIGLSGLGFEVSPDEALRLDARTQGLGGTSAAEPARLLVAETLTSYEAGLRLGTSRGSLSVTAYQADIDHLIERRTMFMAQGAVGTLVGGQPVIRQDASGAVYTALSSAAVFVRANAGAVRMRGIDGNLRVSLPRGLTLTATVAVTHAVDRATGLPPNLENGVPPSSGYVSLRWQPSGRPWWAEVFSIAAARQDRLSSNDLEQARIGATRGRQDIVDFFNHGAVARGLVRNGLLVATGETVEQVIARVLGSDASRRVPLFTSLPGYATLNVRGGWRVSQRMTTTLILENVFDRNYRTMGSGIDAAGVNLTLRHTIAF